MLGNSPNHQAAVLLVIDTLATRLLAQVLSVRYAGFEQVVEPTIVEFAHPD
jgi:hypothetical protein